jgi:hypothetical protein
MTTAFGMQLFITFGLRAPISTRDLVISDIFLSLSMNSSTAVIYSYGIFDLTKNIFGNKVLKIEEIVVLHIVPYVKVGNG